MVHTVAIKRNKHSCKPTPATSVFIPGGPDLIFSSGRRCQVNKKEGKKYIYKRFGLYSYTLIPTLCSNCL